MTKDTKRTKRQAEKEIKALGGVRPIFSPLLRGCMTA